MFRARMFRSLIITTGIKERNIRARNITAGLQMWCKSVYDFRLFYFISLL